MAKKTNPKKDSALNTTQQETEETTKSLSKIANNKIEESLKDFSKISAKQRESLFGNKDFFGQFWLYFKENHPNLLDEIDSEEELTIYVQNLEKKGFSLESIIKNHDLQEEFKETLDEKGTMTESLKQLEEYCSKGENKMPANVFQSFANDIKLGTSPIAITKNTKITKIGNLFSVRKKYLEDNNITLKDHQKSEVEKLLSPNYLPTERLLISATIKKIKKNLPNGLISDFEADFPLPIDIHSEFQNLENVKQRRELFLDGHKTQIDETTAKELDKIIITNGEIYQELQHEGENIEWTKGFSDQTKTFRRMFNKLATRQLFEEAKEKGTYISHHLEHVAKEFKTFPPYFNELLNIYPYKHQQVIEQQPTHKISYDKQTQVLSEKEKEFENADQSKKEQIKKEIITIKEQLNTIKWKAYADYIKSQNNEIGSSIDLLVDNNFDMTKLGKNEQQKITNILVASKLEDSIKNQIPNILGIEVNDYQNFVKNLFDLNQKDIIIPTQYGDIPIHFSEKNFLGGPSKDFMEITTNGEILSEQKNLPLNFRAEINEQNKAFFEDNILFEDLFPTFNSKNQGSIKINDGYKVRITNKEGKPVEGYLSEYPPTKEIEEAMKENTKLKEGRFLYSKPITRPEDTREIVTRDGTEKGEPVVIQKENEKDHNIDILSKEINLNGEAISALLFSYPLGKHNIKNNLSKDQEKKLFEKFGKIENIYHDTLDKHDQEKGGKAEKNEEKTTEEKEKKKRKEFIEEWKSIKGYQEETKKEESVEQEIENLKGTKLLIKGPESIFKPEGSFQYFTAEITKIDSNSGKFTIKFSGNEQQLAQREGKETTIPMTKNSIQKIKSIADDKIYKLPNKEIRDDISNLISELGKNEIDGITPNESFKEVNRNGNDFIIDFGKEKGQKVTHFGLIETYPGDDEGKESKVGYIYETKYDPLKKKFKVTANDKEKTTIYLDHANFILFVASRKLQPQTEKTSKGIDVVNQDGVEIKQPKKRKGYSFASIIGFVKNFGKKIGDGMKKYEEEQTEDLTDKMFANGKLFYALGKIMPTAKLQEAFENAGHEYRSERDNKVFKKIEKYLAFYEKDPDFGSGTSWKEQVEPYLRGEKKFKDHHQGAAMLIATIKKGKGPYSRNTDRAGKGLWIRLLLGDDHQKRYIMMKEKLERDLQQGYKTHGQNWADDIQNEILKLEMKYLIHSIDGRQLQHFPDTPKFEAMYSKKFACELLETESNKFFNEMVSSSTKEKSYNFELARYEYFRLLADRPQQAIPNLKQMALKANSPSQREAIKNAILTGMLSGVFYNITQEDKKFIQRISRSYGFLPGLLIRDPNHHQKIAKLIEIATEDTITYKDGKVYKPDSFGFGKMQDTKQIKDFVEYKDGCPQRFLGTKNGKKRIDAISDFFGRKKNYEKGKKLIEIMNDPKTSNTTRTLLQDIYDRSLEKNENLEMDLHDNGRILEQNILSKNQSHIREIISFEGGEFKGKDEDDRQNKADARKEIAKTIPRGKLTDKNEIISYMEMFMNRFGDRGFNTEEKRFLIRTLLTIKDKKNDPSSDEILRYVIVGNVVRNSGSGSVPDELKEGLEAVKDFFKNNLETIIQPDVVQKGFGNSTFLDELQKGPYKVGDWGEFIDIKTNRTYIGRSKEENEKRNKLKSKYAADETYINEKLYRIAEQIYDRNHVTNKFKKYYNPEETTTIKEKLHKTLEPSSIKIKNPEIIEKVKRKLSGELQNENMSEEEMAEIEDMEEDYYS